ncbi:hypothetical protein ACFWNL_09400 [Kitasatospora sp. NPDC058397]|uniref:hypothetical protein n=1 Tax=unclassified Kitasatospora TaxID=2633591 RepID=UPI003646E01A
MAMTNEEQSTGGTARLECVAHILKVAGRPDVRRPTDTPEALKALNDPFKIMEGQEYQWAVEFRVRDAAAVSVRYIHVVRRAGAKVDKIEQMYGNFPPGDTVHTLLTGLEESPTGVVTRAGLFNYSVALSAENAEAVRYDFTVKFTKTWE